MRKFSPLCFSVMLLFLFAWAKGVTAHAQETVDALELVQEGLSYYSSNDYEKALDYFNQTKRAYVNETDSLKKAKTLTFLGLGFNLLKKNEEALPFIQESIQLLGILGDSFEKAKALRILGGIQQESGMPDAAKSSYRKAQVLANSIEDYPGVIYSLEGLADVYSQFGPADSALAIYRKNIELYSIFNVDDPEGVGSNYHNMGFLYQRKGFSDSALVAHNRAIFEFEKINNLGGQSAVLSALATLNFSQGNYGAVLENYKDAIRIDKQRNHPIGILRNTAALGIMQLQFSRPDSALKTLSEVLSLIGSYPIADLRGSIYLGLSSAHKSLGNLDSALVYLEESLPIWKNSFNGNTEAATLTSIGDIYQSQGETELALDYFRRAIQLADDDGISRANGLSGIGNLYLRKGIADSSLYYLEKALSLQKKVEHYAEVALTLSRLGAIHHLLLDDPQTAIAYYDSSSVIRKSISTSTGSDPNTINMLEQDGGIYSMWSLAWIELAGRNETLQTDYYLAALAAQERGRAQAMLDLMRRTSNNIQPGQNLVTVGKRLAGVVKKSNVQSALSYMITADTLVVWLIKPDESVYISQQPISRDSLFNSITNLRLALGLDVSCESVIREHDEDFNVLLFDIAKWVIPRELRANLPDSGELLILPQGGLNVLPFAALPFQGEPLGLRYALRYAPSFASLVESEQQPVYSSEQIKNNGFFAANPVMPSVQFCGEEFKLSQLEGAELSTQKIAQSLESEAFTGEDASEQNTRAKLSSAPLIHLATHGYSYQEEAFARDSFIALSADYEGDAPVSDGRLTVGEILDHIELNAELVVLSACQTGLGNLKEAEGTIGFQRAFLAKGARSVLLSLWEVNEEATSVLMESFYHHWLGQGELKAEALRKAQLEVRKRQRWKHPRYWAAFQLAGAG